MPIYAYRCAACGHTKDVLRKLSDPPLTTCPGCGAESFQKQLTAAGFQLKGSGWYATDFKGNGNPPAPKPPAEGGAAAPADAKADAKVEPKADAKSDAAAPAPAPAAPPAATSATPASGSR